MAIFVITVLMKHRYAIAESRYDNHFPVNQLKGNPSPKSAWTYYTVPEVNS